MEMDDRSFPNNDRCDSNYLEKYTIMNVPYSTDYKNLYSKYLSVYSSYLSSKTSLLLKLMLKTMYWTISHVS